MPIQIRPDTVGAVRKHRALTRLISAIEDKLIESYHNGRGLLFYVKSGTDPDVLDEACSAVKENGWQVEQQFRCSYCLRQFQPDMPPCFPEDLHCKSQYNLPCSVGKALFFPPGQMP